MSRLVGFFCRIRQRSLRQGWLGTRRRPSRAGSLWVTALVGALSWCGASPVWAQQPQQPELGAAREALAAGRTEDAIRIAERYTRSHPRDERGFLLLGDAWFANMPVGRFQAARAYEAAERLAPRDSEPPYKYALVGLWLGGDDGEGMARHGVERVLELAPLYRDAWDLWLTLFRGEASRRRMRQRLEPFAVEPVVRFRLALLWLEDEAYAQADALLDSALVADSANPAYLALRAQSAFEAGDTAGGARFYERALANADRDTTDYLWHQAVGIASPAEVEAWSAGIPPARRRDWLASFWARRNPDLFAGVNQRLAEHFIRLRFARKHYALLHPLVSYHRSQISRIMNLEPSRGEREFHQRCEMYEVLVPPEFRPLPGGEVRSSLKTEEDIARWVGVPLQGVSRATDRARISPEVWSILTEAERQRAEFVTGLKIPPALYSPLNLSLRGVDSVAARVGYNLATGLDDRGVMYLRFGRPDQAFIGGSNSADPQCHTPDLERWTYPGIGEVRFSRPSAFSGGERAVPDMVFRPMNVPQFEGMRTGLTRDATSLVAPLEFGVWTAQLANVADPALTDLLVVSTRGEVAASVVGATSGASRGASADGRVTVATFPGRFILLAQARDSGQLGRQTMQVTVRPFSHAPAVSDLLLAVTWAGARPDRAAMLGRLQRTLDFEHGTTIRSYAEIYGLRPVAGFVRYRADYQVLRSTAPDRDVLRNDWPDAVRMQFEREVPAAQSGTVVEMLDITPDRTPPGRYLLRLRVWDLRNDADAGQATIAFVVR
ncbi:MAG TPA: hypothetical protein VMT29_04575 [Steroidobacteraceae bacterium]|nr:hypothetical protein [Steroidobacteraceae bacterium]